jgi:hypothetical protein
MMNALEDVVSGFVGKTKDEVCANSNAQGFGLLYGVCGSGKVVASVYVLQCVVEG